MSDRRIGVDFDGTLAAFVQEVGWQGPFVTGKPVPKMVAKVKAALAEGAYVAIFTARIVPHEEENFDIEAAKDVVRAWCLEHIGVELDVTHSKAGFNEMWDDRATTIIPNTGETLKEAVLRIIDEEMDDALIEVDPNLALYAIRQRIGDL